MAYSGEGFSIFGKSPSGEMIVVTVNADGSLVLSDGAASEATLTIISNNIAKGYGTWSYASGTSGTVTVGAGKRVIGIGCHSTAGGSITINGGSSVPVPANVGFAIEPNGNLVAPTIIFTRTDSYL